jgi:hypothetical protein
MKAYMLWMLSLGEGGMAGEYMPPVTTLILNEYRQSSNSSVQAFEFLVSRTTQNAYC